MLLTDETGKVIPQTYQTSNMKLINDKSQNLISLPIVQAFGQDDNNDGLVDQWNITIGLRLPAKT